MREQILQQLQKARTVAADMPLWDVSLFNRVLLDLADRILTEDKFLLAANAEDLSLMPVEDPRYDRLKLTPARLVDSARDLRRVADLECPLHKVLEQRTLPNGLHLSKVSVPLGVVGIIYEARPNVTLDAFALCLKSGNVCVLKGGRDAHRSNQAILQVIRQSLAAVGLPEDTVQLLPSERQAAEVMMEAIGYLDVIIPRGGQALIDYVRRNARVPIIETGAGIVHIYFDKSADLEKGTIVIHNSKTRRPSVCNALDCLILQRDRLPDLPVLMEPLSRSMVTIFADPEAYQALQGHYPKELLLPALPVHYGTEFLSLKMAIKTVADLEEALIHIARYSSRHSEAILAEDPQTVERFLCAVDAAAVYANTSTAFTDGAQFGMGAEIGISTQKLHARGPMALPELTSYKWLVRGNGQIRPA
jgi:glutamate-5-semialdehyde dehydrogenase